MNIPESYLLPTCTVCGEEYFNQEIAEELQKIYEGKMTLIEILEMFIYNIKKHGYKYAHECLLEIGLDKGLYDAMIDGISVSGNFMRSDPETLDPVEDKRDYFAK